MRLATRSSSIRQIEISRAYFENHLLRQMGTILIQKGNSINRDCRFGTWPGSWASEERALKPGCGISNAEQVSAAKICTHLLQPDWVMKFDVGPVAPQGKQTQYNSAPAGITRRFQSGWVARFF
jgi:hypothetical protein